MKGAGHCALLVISFGRARWLTIYHRALGFPSRGAFWRSAGRPTTQGHPASGEMPQDRPAQLAAPEARSSRERRGRMRRPAGDLKRKGATPAGHQARPQAHPGHHWGELRATPSSNWPYLSRRSTFTATRNQTAGFVI
jgi:hypothetical protein